MIINRNIARRAIVICGCMPHFTLALKEDNQEFNDKWTVYAVA